MNESIDPLVFGKICWPDVVFYDKQREIIYSLKNDDETIVVAGNELGKDFVAGFLVLETFMTHREVRIVTTSVKDDHLDILWGEIGRFIDTSKYPLDSRKGGPLLVNHRHIRKIVNGELCQISYIKGMVSAKGEGMAGHHAEHTLLVIDEASGVDEKVYSIASIWADRVLIFGNPNPCTNFFYNNVKAGNLAAPDNGSMYRNVIKIRGQDSPNVRLGEIQKQNGKKITNEVLVPGLITYRDYLKRRAVFDEIRQCISLDAEFYKGPEILLFPPTWLNLAAQRDDSLKGKPRKAKTIGVDSGEGKADTSWAVADNLGLIKLLAMKTADTTVVTAQTIALMREFGIRAENVLFDLGGGGKQHADRLRSQGYNVRTIPFGGGVSPPLRRGLVTIETKKEEEEERYVYRNRRAEMYGILSLRLDPVSTKPWAIPASSEYAELRRQLGLIPKTYDEEGRLYLLPKQNKDPNSTKPTLIGLLGCSPDEADATVLAVYGLDHAGVGAEPGVGF